MPAVTHVRRSRLKGGIRRGIRCFAWVVAVGGAMASPSRAQERDTLHLSEAVAVARGANPMLRVARLRADAARARVPQMGAPPDPVVSLRLGNRPLDGFGAGERMTMNTLQLQQTLPWPGKLGFAEARAAHLAGAEELAVLDAEAALVRRVKGVYFELAFEDRALDIMRDTRDLLREFLDVSNTLYAVGTGLQNDVLQAQVAVATMTEDIAAAEQTRLAMAARLNALLGRGPERNVGPLELPGARRAPSRRGEPHGAGCREKARAARRPRADPGGGVGLRGRPPRPLPGSEIRGGLCAPAAVRGHAELQRGRQHPVVGGFPPVRHARRGVRPAGRRGGRRTRTPERDLRPDRGGAGRVRPRPAAPRPLCHVDPPAGARRRWNRPSPPTASGRWTS